MYGENLYWSWSSDPAWELHGEEAVHSWYQERRGYSYDKEPQDTESGKHPVSYATCVIEIMYLMLSVS